MKSPYSHFSPESAANRGCCGAARLVSLSAGKSGGIGRRTMYRPSNVLVCVHENSSSQRCSSLVKDGGVRGDYSCFQNRPIRAASWSFTVHWCDKTGAPLSTPSTTPERIQPSVVL